MPNETDQDRMNSRMQGANVVDLDAYRASTRASTGSGYLDRHTLSWLKMAMIAVVVVFLFLRFAR